MQASREVEQMDQSTATVPTKPKKEKKSKYTNIERQSDKPIEAKLEQADPQANVNSDQKAQVSKDQKVIERSIRNEVKRVGKSLDRRMRLLLKKYSDVRGGGDFQMEVLNRKTGVWELLTEVVKGNANIYTLPSLNPLTTPTAVVPEVIAGNEVQTMVTQSDTAPSTSLVRRPSKSEELVRRPPDFQGMVESRKKETRQKQILTKQDKIQALRERVPMDAELMTMDEELTPMDWWESPNLSLVHI